MAERKIKAGIPSVQIVRSPGKDLLFRLVRAGFYALILGYLPGILAVVGGLGFVAYWLVRRVLLAALAFGPGGWAFALFVGILALSLVLVGLTLLIGLVPLAFRHSMPEPFGERLDPKRHKRLHALVQRICQRLRTRPPDLYVVRTDDGAAIGDFDIDYENRIVKNVRTLMIGAGLVSHTSVAELTTVLCHELAHAATGDTRLSRIAYRFYDSLREQIELCSARDTNDDRTTAQRILYLALICYHWLLSLFYALDCRYREYRADRISAEICGPQNVRTALLEIYLVSKIEDLSGFAVFVDALENEREIENIYEEHRQRWATLSLERRQRAESELFMDPGSAWSTHPPLAKRIRNLADVDTPELKAPEPASTLFHQWEMVEQRLTRRLMARARVIHAARMAGFHRKLDRIQTSM